MAEKTRIERDSMGEMSVPSTALYGASTQRAVLNFPVSGRPVPPSVIHAFGLLKRACAEANMELKKLDRKRGRLTDSERRQLNRMRDSVAQVELAFENMRDPGFLSVVVSATARRYLGNGSFPRALPTGARFYASTSKLGNNRYKLVFINLEGGAPVIQEDEGTLEELRQKHEGITFIRNE